MLRAPQGKDINMSEELFALRQAIEAGDTTQALALLDEMDEMSLDDKMNKVRSFMRVLLMHRMKQAAEKRSTRSWEHSIDNAILSIADTNKRHKSGGYYLDEDTLAHALARMYPRALKSAALEAFGGVYEADQLGAMVDREPLLTEALEQILDAQRTEGNA